MRQSWTDDRLDDLSRHIDQRFDKVEGEISALRVEFGALNRTLLQVGGGMVAALVAALIGFLVTQL